MTSSTEVKIPHYRVMGIGMALGLVLGGLVGILIDQMIIFAGGGMILGLATGLALEGKR